MRYELKWTSADEIRVEYALSIDLPGERYSGAAELGVATGTVAFTWREGEPPAWAEDIVRAQLRTMQREAATGKAFPRRVTRWREGPVARAAASPPAGVNAGSSPVPEAEAQNERAADD